MSEAKRDFFIIVIGKILQIVFMLAIIKISTRLLGPKDMGSMYMLMAFSAFFMLTFLNPIGQYIQRHLNEWKESGALANNIVYHMMYVMVVSLLAVCFMVIYIAFMGMPVDFSRTNFLILFFLYLSFTYLNLFIIFLLNLLYYRTVFILLTLFTAMGILLFGYLFVDLFGKNAEHWLYGLITSNIIFTIVAYIYFKNRVGLPSFSLKSSLMDIDSKSMAPILTFVVPLALASIFMWVQHSGYRIIIESNNGLSFLGFFSIGLVVATQIATVFESIALQYLYPSYYQEITNATLEHRTMAINNFINKALPIYFLLALFLTFLAKYVVEILVDEQYYEAYIFTVFGIWVEFFKMASNLFGNIAQSEMNTKKFLVPYIFGSLVTIVLVYLASIQSNYQLYLPMALVLGSFSTMLLMYFSMQKLLKFTIDYKLLLLATLMSIPFMGAWYISVESSFLTNFLIVLVYGLYFLGVIYFIYLKGLKRVEPTREIDPSVKLLMWI